MRNANFLNSIMFRILSKTRNQNIFDLHVSSPQSLLRLLSKRANENLPLGLKNRLTSGQIVNRLQWLRHTSWNVKPHECTCVVRAVRLQKLRRAGDLKSMSSKTILLGLSIFRCGSERSVHKRPSWELAPYDHESERTKDFTVWCRDASTECCFMSALDSVDWKIVCYE